MTRVDQSGRVPGNGGPNGVPPDTAGLVGSDQLKLGSSNPQTSIECNQVRVEQLQAAAGNMPVAKAVASAARAALGEVSGKNTS